MTTVQQFDDTNRFENITLDKEALLFAYLELDKIFKDLRHVEELNFVYRCIEKATGYGFIRQLEKKPQKELSKIKI